MRPPTVSVVVPTRDRPRALERCLLAVSRLVDVDVDTVVVDDGSVDRAAVAAAVGRGDGRLVRLDGRGPSTARNAGARAAEAEVVCFLDDDCEPEPGWAAHLADAIAGGAASAGGRTRTGNPSNPFDVASERITGHLREHSFAHRPSRGFLASNNLACTRGVALAFPFDERFGVGGEDRDWCARVAAGVGPPVLVPEAVVVHTPDLTLGRFWRQQMSYGRGAFRFAGDRAPRPMGAGFYFELLRGGFADGLRPGVLVLLAQVATAAGVVSARRENRRRR
jgi:glycosyltransferase involved in cell wall biosynthesis